MEHFLCLSVPFSFGSPPPTSHPRPEPASHHTNTRENLTISHSFKIAFLTAKAESINKLKQLKTQSIIHIKVAPYSFMTARALMMQVVVICARSHEIVGFPDIL